MSALQDPHEIVDLIYNHVEANAVDKAVFACLRLARSVSDPFNSVMFLRDMGTYKDGLVRELQSLNEKTIKYIWEHTGEEWMNERKVFPSNSDNAQFIGGSAGDLQRDVAQFEQSIGDLKIPEGMGEFDTAAFADRHITQKRELRIRIRQNNAVIERIRGRCQSYASRIETQLKAQERTSSLVLNLQNDVDNFFVTRCPDAHAKLTKASSLAGSADPEDHSLLLASIRRAVKAVADYWYPARDKTVDCADGKKRSLRDDAYLNRLQEFCATLKSGSATKLLQAELGHLAAIVRRLNEVASKGVHGEVSQDEARQGLLTLYTFLSNLIVKLQ